MPMLVLLAVLTACGGPSVPPGLGDPEPRTHRDAFADLTPEQIVAYHGLVERYASVEGCVLVRPQNVVIALADAQDEASIELLAHHLEGPSYRLATTSLVSMNSGPACDALATTWLSWPDDSAVLGNSLDEANGHCCEAIRRQPDSEGRAEALHGRCVR